MKEFKKIIKASLILLFAFVLSSCTKEVPKELMNNQQNTTSPHQQNQQQQQTQQNQQMPDDDIHRNINKNQSNSNDTSVTKGDPKAEEMTKAADAADERYQKTKSETDKKECIQKQLAAANYLMFEANLSPKKKYKPALQRYRRVLELDPQNAEAKENKQQIEDIYQSMGMPIPN